MVDFKHSADALGASGQRNANQRILWKPGAP